MHNLLNSDNNIATIEQIKFKLKGHVDSLRVISLIQAIPKEWKTKICNNKQNFKEIPSLSININNVPKSVLTIQSKMVYWELMTEKIKPPTAIVTWLDLFPFLEKLDWKGIFVLPFQLTKEPYLQTFQYKILNRSLNCNHNLTKWKIIQNDKCSYCEHIDTLEHYLYYCPVSESF